MRSYSSIRDGTLVSMLHLLQNIQPLRIKMRINGNGECGVIFWARSEAVSQVALSARLKRLFYRQSPSLLVLNSRDPHYPLLSTSPPFGIFEYAQTVDAGSVQKSLDCSRNWRHHGVRCRRRRLLPQLMQQNTAGSCRVNGAA